MVGLIEIQKPVVYRGVVVVVVAYVSQLRG